MSSLFQLVVVIAVATLICLLRMVAFALGSVLYLYLLPGVIALKRNYAHANRLFLVCAVAGWTVVVWVAALGFALSLPNVAEDPLPTSVH